MNQDIKNLWVAALRSGEFIQGRHLLRDNDTYCCLGVLCELHRRVTGETDWSFDNEYLYTATFLPHRVIAWAEVIDRAPRIGQVSLASLNDGTANQRKHSFAEIADLIEAHL